VARALAKVPSWSTIDVSAEYVFGSTKASAEYDGFGTMQLAQLPNSLRLVAIRGEHQEWQVQRYFSSGTAGFTSIPRAEIENMASPAEATAADAETRAATPRSVDATGRQTDHFVHVFVGDARRPSTPAGSASTSRSQAPMSEAAAPDEDDEDAPETSGVANEEDEAQSSRSWARAAALHDAEAMVRMMGPGVQARVGGVVVQATPDWKPPNEGAATQDHPRTRDGAAGNKLQVARTILEQLGGQRFIAMTGAKNLVGEAHALTFKLPANFAKDGINHVRISLEPSDTYTVRFARLGRAPAHKLTEVAVVEDVYADDLQDVFTRYTGLDTSLAAGPSVAKKPKPEPLAEESTPSHAPSAEEEQSEALPEDDEDTPEPAIVERASPVEHRTAAARRDANIKAMVLAADLESHPHPLTEEERRTLLEYSDWGGVGIGKWASRFPPGFPVPEKRQLIHAYFTPPAVCAEIARIVKPLLPGLVSTDGKVHALEPAAGIGRFPLALSGPGFEALAWHCVEYSTVSHKMLRLLRPDIDLFHGPFERWIAERAEDFAGRLKLVISNPPYGQRNQALTEDPDRSYRLDRADAYFLRRGLDLLGAGGLGIFIIPSGFLTGTTEDAKRLREEVLRRHHLAAAFRLPNEVFSLANVVTDILFFRARGAILSEVDDADRFILDGRYYEEFPSHILGEIVQNEPGQHGWHSTGEGYTVVGDFTAIPPFEERPMCSACRHLPAPGPVEPPPTPAASEASKADQIIDRDERMAAAVGLGRRVEAFLASVANPDHEPIGWDELHHDLTEWAETHGAPGKDKDVITLAKAERGPLGRGEPGGAGWLLKAFLGVSSTLIPPLEERPRWAPRFLGDANDPLQVGDYLYRTHKTLRIEDLPGQDPSALFAAGWCEDSLSAGWAERLDVRGELFPPDEYLYGELWPKFDRADARGRLGDVQAAAQARRLLEFIQPATFDEIEISPQDGFIPLDLVATWLATLNHGEAVHLVRDKGLVHLADVEYEDHGHGLLDLSQEALLCLGWINHDYVVFQPYAGKDDNIDEIRLGYAKDWTERFRAFCEADPERQRAIERSYQRARQGYRAHGYGSEPLKLLRWNPAIVLNPHQIAGARRLDANGGGGLGFDVGVGKTFTLLAALALARQGGRARRPVIVVPQPIALQWVDNIGKALPDFRVVVIGLNKKTLSRGLRKGLETTETDTPEERSRKWARFQGGEFDVAIVTYESLPRSKMDQDSMLRFIEGVSAIEREVELKRRNAKMQQKQSEQSYREKKESLDAKLTRAKEEVEHRFGIRKQKAQEKQRKLEAKLRELEEKHSKRRLTERQEAILEEGVGAWLAEMLELPEGWKHDPDIVWQKLGITWIAFDEAHNGKNLHMPSSREGGSVPKFMGNEGEGSHRAWHWYFRCCDVQSRGGEVILATATPASNSPLEFYNLVKLIDDKAWARIGIHDPEAFIDRFCLLEPEEVVTVDMQTQTRMACVGFKNLDELRSVVMKLWEFKTAKQAGLKLPKPKIERVFVNMDAAQEKKYQQYVDEIEYALAHPKEGSHKILGLLQRMASVAQHAQLDEKFDWADAHLVASPHSPKYDALAKRVLALRGCGHIVFSDYVPAHAWIRDVLIEAGIPAQRIGILNAVVAPTAADRQRTAREFNGSEGVAPKYDVLIANMIGEEGVDLQRRACAIHHMDIGWTPKKFDQRNGRGYRQGNTLSNIEIIYYIANRSQDGSRLDMVRGKQNWISSLLEGEGKEVNNPAAQSTLTRKELLVLISRDPEKTRARLEAAEAEREEERKKKVAAAASGTLRAVANRFDRARTETSPTVAAEHLSVARQKLAGLAKVDPAIWPWMPWAQEAERHSMLVPKEGGPVYESLRVAMPRLLDRSMIDYAEFGRVDGSTIGTRVAGTAHWDETSLDKVVQLRLAPEMRLAEGSAGTWPADDQPALDRAMTEKWLPRLRSGAGTNAAWAELGWTRAPNGFVERQWSRWGGEIVAAAESTGGWAANLRVPVVARERLVLGLRSPHGEVIPPTLAGWQRFLALAPASGAKFGEIEDVGRWWFGRTIPRTLLSAARDDDPAAGGASTAPPSKSNVPPAA
jgi:predicted RNA methylase